MKVSRRIFIGYDPRQPVAFQVLSHSLFRHASKSISIVPLVLNQLPITRRGLTEFTFTRYLVPYLCEYHGLGLFLDADMLCLGDITEVFDLFDGSDVMVVKNKERFEWPSMMLFNGDSCKSLTPSYIEDTANKPYSLEWAKTIGSLPSEWNHCVGYDEQKEAKLIHYTMGIPCFEETKHLGFRDEWFSEHKAMNSTVTWQDLMGNSVHAKKLA